MMSLIDVCDIAGDHELGCICWAAFAVDVIDAGGTTC